MKKIILGISSSISAYKACDLIRILVKGGFSVHTVVTENALNLVTPLTLETLSGNPVYSDSFSRDRREMGHIELKRDAALLAVVPATANIIGKFANGIADDLLSTTYLSVDCPVLVAPAMNPFMYKHPAVQENLSRLRSRGVRVVEPEKGLVACGDEGYGRLADIETIYGEIMDAVKG
ncbi:MAG TPA: flavoprotein [Spirochaetota bacterium]|nr:flavoprotein [Spirochaetota bacterium]HPR47732.1 flavoprotein [Spirochaetota bacterium]